VSRENVVPSETFAKGVAIGTTPAAGAKLKRGTGVVLTLSSGAKKTPPPKVVIPDVADKPRQEAFNELADRGLQVTVRLQADARPSGMSVGTDPAAGTSVNGGSKVTLIVSTGPPTPEVMKRATLVLFPGGHYELDQGAATEVGADFLVRPDEFVRLEVLNGATFALAPAGAKSNYDGCRRVSLSDAAIPYDALQPGRVLCVRTNEGRMSVARVDGGGGGSGEIQITIARYRRE
jgi:hypothetical protein